MKLKTLRFEAKPASMKLNLRREWGEADFLIRSITEPREAALNIAQVHLSPIPPGEAQALARLFAAAPDLLAACKAVIDTQRKHPEAVSAAEWRELWDKVLQAIGKATGASSPTPSGEAIRKDSGS